MTSSHLDLRSFIRLTLRTVGREITVSRGDQLRIAGRHTHESFFFLGDDDVWGYGHHQG